MPGSSAASAETVLSRRYRALTLGIVSVVLLVAFEATAVGTAMPVAARDLHGLSLYGFGFSGYFTTSLFAMVVSGQWCDRSGPLAPLSTGIGCFAAGLVVSGTAQAMWPFIAGRAVQGVGGGLLIVALYVVVGRAYPERLRPSVLAAFAASWVVPSIVGPLVSGAVTEQLGWRWVFLGIPVLVALPVSIALPALRRVAVERPSLPEESPGAADPPVRGRRRILLALGVSLGAALLQYAGQDVRTWWSLLPGLAGVAVLAPSAVRLLPPGTFRAGRGLPSVVLLRGIAAGSFLAAESFVPLMLVTQRQLSPTLAGLSLAGGGLTWALGSYVQSRPRLEPYRERLVRAGMGLVVAAIVGAALVLVPGVPAWIVAVAWCVGGLGMGMVIASMSVLLLQYSPPREAGANSAALQVCDALSNVVLVAAGGVLFAALGGGAVAATGGTSTVVHGHPAAFAAVFCLAAAVALVGMAVAGRVRRGPDRGAESPSR
ncbi:MFS transporter [Streptantibioticus ferralitis]|uniref:MFS transporter n=1 Tax=Streptantibioticus ferralitis TaxID=236510 RepID=A0ABT5YWP4_9ACTN|nr:MFS transporter [Streptantibioticus ferralitis]MDF2255270.1 MFS transporter [Streptantibioticus ferralitis]